MLKEGFHQSFRELFNLMEKQKEEIASLGPDSGLSDQPLLEDEPEKLDQLKYHLTTAEAAKRRGKKYKYFCPYLTHHGELRQLKKFTLITLAETESPFR